MTVHELWILIIRLLWSLGVGLSVGLMVAGIVFQIIGPVKP